MSGIESIVRSVSVEIEVDVGGEVKGIVRDWPQFLAAAVLVMIRLSSLMVFTPIFSSAAISPRVKAGFVAAMTLLLAPVVASVPGARVVLDGRSILGELAVGMVFGLSLMMLTEALEFAGMLLGIQFSFSLVNLLDPNTMIDTPVLAQMLNWLGILVLIHAGLDRTLIAALVHTFCTVPVGQAVLHASTGPAVAAMVSGVFLAGIQLAAPVMAATMTVEITVALIGRLSPQLPAMVVSIPIKTMTAYVVLVGSLALWPGWIEGHFVALLDAAQKIVVHV